MTQTKEREGELALLLFRATIEKELHIRPLTDIEANSITNGIVELFEKVPQKYKPDYNEFFELYRKFLPETSQPAFDRAVISTLKSKKL